jgi:enoyl-CoA hydratase/carnithine racemase
MSPSTEDGDIVLDVASPVATITIDRPGDDNRFRRADMERLGEIVAALGADDTVHAVVVTGAGEAFFSAGLLNPEIRGSLPKDEILDFVFLANRVFDALEALPQMVIAAINGTVMAGAVELALACDIRLVADHAKLSMPEAKWGGFPGAGGPVRLPMVVGHGRAMELIGTGREIDAAEMERIGLVERVHPGDALRDAASEMARTIGANGPLATRGAKRIARVRRDAGFAASRALSDALRHALEWSADVDEGIASHREGRAAKFTGR